jgi:hypothetical protein
MEDHRSGQEAKAIDPRHLAGCVLVVVVEVAPASVSELVHSLRSVKAISGIHSLYK